MSFKLYVCFVLLICHMMMMIDLSQSQIEYDFDVSTATPIGINQVYQHKVNFFPEIIESPVYTYFPAPQFNPIYSKHTLIKDNSRWAPDLNPSDWSPPINLTNTLSLSLIIPAGMTLISSSFSLSNKLRHTFVVHGVFKTNPAENVTLSLYEMVIYPTGTLQVRPSSPSIKHEITLQASHYQPGSQNPVSSIALFDPFGCLSFLCLGCTIDIQGDTSPPSWIGVKGDTNTSTVAVPLLNDASGYKNGTPLVRINRPIENGVNDIALSSASNVTANYDNTTKTITIPSSRSTGYVNLYPSAKNVIFSSTSNAPIVITGPANVNFKSALFRGIGWTSNNPFDNTKQSNTTLNYNHYGWNQEDRYGITLLHVLNPVVIDNCIFDDTGSSTRFMIGAKRSFGKITNNAFLLTTHTSSGIGLLYGTESFDIQNNGFISLWNQTTFTSDLWTPPVRNTSYPDIGCINCAIYSTSPYFVDGLKQCAFEGGFLGGAVLLEPLQNRSALTGVNVDLLVGNLAGQTQDNRDNYQLNAQWQPLLANGLVDNLFTYYSDVRVNYSSQPALVLQQRSSTFVRVQSTAPSQESLYNVHLSFDNCNFISFMQEAPYSASCTSPIFKGSYVGVSIKNSTVNKVTGLFDKVQSGDIGYLGMTNVIMQGNIFPTEFVSTIIPLSFYDDVTIASVFLVQRLPITTVYTPRPIVISTGGNITLHQTFLPIPTTSSFQFNRSIFLDDQLFFQLNGSTELISSAEDELMFSSTSPGFHKVLATNNPTNSDGIYITPKSYTSVYTTALIKSAHPSNFYLGIALVESDTPVSLEGFNGRWTKCQHLPDVCTLTGGAFGSLVTTPTSMTNSSDGTTTNDSDLIEILSSYYSTTQEFDSVSRLEIMLKPGEYTFYLYFVNSHDVLSSNASSSQPFFQVKMNGQLQLGLPMIYQTPPSQQFLVTNQYYFNNYNSSTFPLVVEWGYTQSHNISLAGIEIFSNWTQPFEIVSQGNYSVITNIYLLSILIIICIITIQF
ncbi:hypothetical protein DFA_07611 [Cavenderia fasciculata]|uniref:Uncharacterized protein n=1 Tax=Cavenderia fasciculata TaxID=261658 RepID=F4Q647_CACFS|nr:uncharacterized protein DFA_07611 [Cavenderia fasciculata]EGG16633.1 hypothetical protein DFA_07611 [Cavenderia fasciculata]|eukprot:XP_004355107.1 hypothetical protein DFA_07611 [Cavenderia fasciculata]